MIALRRERLAGKIHANFCGETKKGFERELLQAQRRIACGELTKHKWQDGRWKAAKDQLIAEAGGKCAYCEAPTTQVAYGDVEHFRPKSEYWWLAYCYDNYLVSCQLCNQKYKKAKFPIKNGPMPAPPILDCTTDDEIEALAGKIAPDPLDPNQVEAFRLLHEQERPLLLNPYFDDPAEYYAWRADGVKKEVALVPLPTNPESGAFVQAAIKNYGLNRKELRDYRWAEYEKYWTFRASLEAGVLPAPLAAQTQHMIEAMKSATSPYAGMICYFDGLALADLPAPPPPPPSGDGDDS